MKDYRKRKTYRLSVFNRSLMRLWYMTSHKVQNLIRMKIQYHTRKTWTHSFPKSLTIEPTNICNLHCPFCHTGSGKSNRPKGYMRLEDFRMIVDKNKKYLNEIILHNQGEPTLNKNIFNMIHYAKINRILTIMSSNLTLFTEDCCEKIIDSGLDTLIVSIDGVSEDTYNKYRVGANYQTVYRNLERLVSIKGKKKKATPNIIWSFLVFQHNRHEIDKAAELAHKLGCDFFAQSAALGGEVNTWEKDECLKEKWLVNDESVYMNFDYDSSKGYLCKGACHWLWNGFVVQWDGTIVPCCFIDDKKYAFGNILEEDIRVLWNNECFRAGRNIFRNRPEDGIKKSVICEICKIFEKPAREQDKK